jgi:hypothetical protein
MVSRSTQRWSALVGLVALVVLIAVVALPSERRAPEVTSPLVDPQTFAALVEIVSPAENGEPLQVEPRIAAARALGDAGAVAAIALECGLESWPEVELAADGEPVHSEAHQLRAPVVRALIESCPPERRLQHFAALGHGASVDVRRVMFVWIGAIEAPAAVTTLLALTDGVEPIQWQRDYIARPFEFALAARVAARPDALLELRGRLRELAPEVAALAARACASVGSKPALEFALDTLGRADDYDLALLAALARGPRRTACVVDPAALERLGRRLEDSDPNLRRAAIDACGTLAYVGALEPLVEILESPDPVLAQAAHRALVVLARSDHGRDARAWRLWVREEERWRNSHWDALLEELVSSVPGRAARAVRELASHPLQRDEAAEQLAELVELDTAPPALLLDALVSLRSARALPGLVALLESEDAALAERAHRALIEQTGLELDADPSSWERLLRR